MSMIPEFVAAWESRKDVVRAAFAAEIPDSYEDIVKIVIGAIADRLDEVDDDFGRAPAPDPKRIHTINDGDYGGTMVFVIGAKGYQPSTYWGVSVDYGSCSG